MSSTTTVAIDKIVTKVTKYAEENPYIMGASVVATLTTGFLIFGKAQMKRDGNDYNSQLTGGLKILNNTDHTLKNNEFQDSISDYMGMFAGARKDTGAITSKESVDQRKQRYEDMINHFYNLVTDFYEWGWGQSFHFGPRFHDETFVESIKRTEYYLALRLGLKAGMSAVDIGCGVGGPMRNICVHTGAKIDGITINQYQVNIGNKYNEQHGLAHLCKLTRGDFQDLVTVFGPGRFDTAYEIEATCHSPDRVKTFSGVYEVLKPGGKFAGYEWVMTDKYDSNNKDHVRIKEGIEEGNGLPTLVHYTEIVRAMEKSGFKDIEFFDANRNVHAVNEIPWYDTLNGKMSISGFRMTHIGRLCTHTMVWCLETLRIAPAGSTEVSAMLNATAIDLCDGGKLEIFTPSFFFIGTKPL